MRKTIKLIILIWISGLLAACVSSNSKEKIFGKTTPTIQQVYQEKFQHRSDINRQSIQREIHNEDTDLSNALRSQFDALQEQFPRLPNPALILYVYPHLTRAGRPVPGYYTTFPFYIQDQHALPGEVTENFISKSE